MDQDAGEARGWRTRRLRAADDAARLRDRLHAGRRDVAGHLALDDDDPRRDHLRPLAAARGRVQLPTRAADVGRRVCLQTCEGGNRRPRRVHRIARRADPARGRHRGCRILRGACDQVARRLPLEGRHGHLRLVARGAGCGVRCGGVRVRRGAVWQTERSRLRAFGCRRRGRSPSADPPGSTAKTGGTTSSGGSARVLATSPIPATPTPHR